MTDTLAKQNFHPRDAHITFDENPHIYTIDGDSNYMSVTSWVHSHFAQFNADKIITKIMSGPHWSTSKYYGMTSDQIKALWETNRDNAAQAGTKLHYDIECYYNDISVINDSVEFSYFMNFVRDFPALTPYRTEWMIWDKELRLAGSIDMVYQNTDGTLMIYDWKRSRDIIRNKPFETYSSTNCISHIPDTNFWHYSLQLNTYKSILERHYNTKVTSLCLVCLHPEKKAYQMINVPDLSQEISELFEIRKQQVYT
jgi:hypothetical protein